MGAKLTDYEHDLRKRLEIIRKRARITQRDMADKMGVTLERYKRFAYGKAKVPSEALARLIERLPADADYLMTGRPGEKRVELAHLVAYYIESTDADKALFHSAMARSYNERIPDTQLDYITDKSLRIEMKDEGDN